MFPFRARRFRTFMKLFDKTEAENYADILKSDNIECLVEVNKLAFDASFANAAIDTDIELKLYPQDFTRARNLIDTYYEGMLQDVPQDYYINNLTDSELQNIIMNRDEWG